MEIIDSFFIVKKLWVRRNFLLYFIVFKLITRHTFCRCPTINYCDIETFQQGTLTERY
nr:hypothetical protein [Dinophyceae sp. MRD-151]